jgi:hypothetical protein
VPELAVDATHEREVTTNGSLAYLNERVAGVVGVETGRFLGRPNKHLILLPRT